MLYIASAFSLSMLDRRQQTAGGIDIADGQIVRPRVPRPITIEQVRQHVAYYGTDVKSVIGHADRSDLLSALVGVSLPVNRVSVKLTKNDSIIVGQYSGPRLPEGATSLPEGATIEWWII